MAAKKTKQLIKLIETRAGDYSVASEVQQLIEQGADITAATKNGLMIDSVIAERNRHQSLSPLKAQYYNQVIQVLLHHASNLLVKAILSPPDQGQLDEVKQLMAIQADCCQNERYGPLGLLGELLKQNKVAIPLGVVEYLIKNNQQVESTLSQRDNQGQTYLSLSQANITCPKPVTAYIQRAFDLLLNRIPFATSPINASEVVEWIHRGANPEAVDEQGNTVLCNAVLRNNLNLVQALVSAGCNVSHANLAKLTPLQIASNATPRNAQLVAVLEAQNNNAELKQLIERKKSLLTVEEVHAVLSKGANINAMMTDRTTFLHLLISNEGTPEMITAFVNDFLADVFALDTRGYRPIETCIMVDKSPFVKLQTFLNLPKLSAGVFFNPQWKKSIYQFAKDQNRPEAAKIIQDALNLRLWNSIAGANTKDGRDQNLLPDLKQLVDYGAQIEHKHTNEEYEQWTVLHLACKQGAKERVQGLIETLAANHLSVTGNNDSSISIAAEFGHLAIVQYLRQLLNVSLNTANKDKQTPLHLGTKNHHLRVVRYLILWGADHRAENIHKQTPLDIARSNPSSNKKDETNDQALIHCLQQLVCPVKSDPQQVQSTNSNYDLDTCTLSTAVTVEEIRVTSVGDEERLGQESRGLLAKNANENLFRAIKDGSLHAAKAALGAGANICHQKDGMCAYGMAHHYINEYNRQCLQSQTRQQDYQMYLMKLNGCQQIAADIQQIATSKLRQGIELSKAYYVVAYHRAGALLTTDLIAYTCSQSDNVQIVDYLIEQSADMHQAMLGFSAVGSPYHIARQHRFNQVAAYLNYRLSQICTEAVKQNRIDYVRELIRAGASVDMLDTNNLQVALQNRNAKLVELLCDNGAKLPNEWIRSKTILLPETLARTMDADLVCRINRCLVNRRLRIAAASGDLREVINCQHLGADINAENCHGSTALLCSIDNGNHFPIVHALVSRGASMLHSNVTRSSSLIALAQKKQYTAIAKYLTDELNTQFLSTILNNDQKSAAKFEALGADFNYQDEQNRTALHYAVQYHGIELVSWLCVRGSKPTIADSNGNYPMTEAAEKGDYAVVELFATKYPATKQQKNKDGTTALQIAQKQGFRRIAYVLETGKPAPDTIGDEEAKPQGPKHTVEELTRAAKNGQLKVIKEFIDDPYDSRDEKRKLCYGLISVAKTAHQHEVVSILQPYHDKQLKAELPSDIEVGSSIRLNQHYKKILLGFLTGLGRVIAESSVELDPADPNTYKELFSDLTSNQRKRARELQNVGSAPDARKLSEQDFDSINDKLAQVQSHLEQLQTEKTTLQKQIEDNEDSFRRLENVSAITRRDLFQQQEEHQKHLKTIESSAYLYELQQEAMITRRNTVQFIKNNANMYLFFRTIEDLLQALFHGVLAARSGLLSKEKTSKFSTAATVIEAVPTSFLPFSDIIIGAVTSTISSVLSKLDEKQQKKEYLTISTYGNIEELTRIASDTAGLVTLYYKEQIQSIDVATKIKGSNIFNHAVNWIKTVLVDVRAESDAQMPVVLVAEFVTGLIMETIKAGKEKLSLTEPIPQQLWFCLAKENCVKKGKLTAATDILGATAGQIRIPLNRGTDNKSESVAVQLRHLIGCVSVVTQNGEVYQYDAGNDSEKQDFVDLEIFGYVYVTPFLTAHQSWEPIRHGRLLKEAVRDEDHSILSRLKDIEQYVQSFQSQGDRTRHSTVTTETARQIAEVLRDQKAFVDPNDMDAALAKSRQKVELDIGDLREDIMKKTEYYQLSIDAATEKLEQGFANAREALSKESEERFKRLSKKSNEQLQEMQAHLEKQLMQRMDAIEQEVKQECDQMRQIVELAKANSAQALRSVTEAAQASAQSAQCCQEVAEQAKELMKATEQRRQELQVVMERCESSVQLTIKEQKESCAQTIDAVRAKVQQDFERMKQAAEGASMAAKDSAHASKEAAKLVQQMQKDTRMQLTLQKQETDKVVSQAESVTKQNERLANEAEEAKKQAIKGAEHATTALKKVETMYEKMVKELDRVEKLARKLDSK